MNRRWVLAGLMGLAGCATLPPPRLVKPAEPLEELEPLILAWPTAEGLVIRVTSRGCTAKADWTFYVERDGRTARLAFARKALDVCRSPGGQVDLVFSWAELGLPRGIEVRLLNPLAG